MRSGRVLDGRAGARVRMMRPARIHGDRWRSLSRAGHFDGQHQHCRRRRRRLAGGRAHSGAQPRGSRKASARPPLSSSKNRTPSRRARRRNNAAMNRPLASCRDRQLAHWLWPMAQCCAILHRTGASPEGVLRSGWSLSGCEWLLGADCKTLRRGARGPVFGGPEEKRREEKRSASEIESRQ